MREDRTEEHLMGLAGADEWPPPLSPPAVPTQHRARPPWRGFGTGLLANSVTFMTSLPGFVPWASRLPIWARGPLQHAGTTGMFLLIGFSLACLALDIRRCRRAGDGTGVAWAIVGAVMNVALWFLIFWNSLPDDCGCDAL